mmetsp:Transcript_39949/g.87209  ORF Transcript_39949/g.87209 Transcript_39949/m.87209 type:complete len:280 (+) Transcript_39949:1707-2546(+)
MPDPGWPPMPGMPIPMPGPMPVCPMPGAPKLGMPGLCGPPGEPAGGGGPVGGGPGTGEPGRFDCGAVPIGLQPGHGPRPGPGPLGPGPLKKGAAWKPGGLGAGPPGCASVMAPAATAGCDPAWSGTSGGDFMGGGFGGGGGGLRSFRAAEARRSGTTAFSWSSSDCTVALSHFKVACSNARSFLALKTMARHTLSSLLSKRHRSPSGGHRLIRRLPKPGSPSLTSRAGGQASGSRVNWRPSEVQKHHSVAFGQGNLAAEKDTERPYCAARRDSTISWCR